MNEPVNFKYNLQQDVKIVSMDVPGKIFARCDRGNGIHDYRVIYWCESKRSDDWLYEYELSEI